MIWVFALLEIKNKWYLKYDYDKFADIGKIVGYLGKTVSLAILNIHALTCYDTTSYFYKVGKIKVLKKVLQNEMFCLLLSNLRIEKVLSDRTIENIKEFIKTVLYSGMGNGTYIEMRIRLHKSLKQKSSLSIPPDPDSVVQAIKRVHYQTTKWFQCTSQNIVSVPFEGNGWTWCGDGSIARPVWYTGKQLPETLQNKSKKRRKSSNKSETETPLHSKTLIDKFYDGDDEAEIPIFLVPQTGYSESEDESDWEVSDFLSSEDSCDEWLP